MLDLADPTRAMAHRALDTLRSGVTLPVVS